MKIIKGAKQMSTNSQPYVEYKPGELIAAEVMNNMQAQIRDDIATQAQEAVAAITQVPSAQDSEKLEGQSLADITQSIIDEAISQITMRSGYVRLYKKLKVGEEVVIEHNLKNSPLVDLYQLDYFQVVASEDDYKYPTWVNFYLYHSGEKTISFKEEGATGRPTSYEIEPSDGSEPYRIPFAELLARYHVDYNENSSLGEIVEEFWDALFAAPNDSFDPQQYPKSPWFDRCCMEERTVKSLKQRGHWDDMWVKVVPRQTVNDPYVGEMVDDNSISLSVPNLNEIQPMPTQVHVSHFNFNKLGLTLLTEPVHSAEVKAGLQEEKRDISEELKLMVLLRA
jgi:hypothetical protein